MRKLCAVGLLLTALSVQGASVKTGKERLRELVIMPEVHLNFTFPQGGSRADCLEDYLVPAEIDKLQKEAKEHPDDPECLLRLGALMDRGGGTNDGTAYYQEAEKAARRRSAARPQDGLALTFLGGALAHLGKDAEAESVFRKATIVSSNEWKCWIRLGKYLCGDAYNGLLPKDYFKQTSWSLPVLLSLVANYKPPPGDLIRCTALRKESEQCFERAISLAPKEPDVNLAWADKAREFAVADWLIRFYHDGKPPDAKEYSELNYPAAQIQCLEKAARLCPDDYRVVGVAMWQDITSAAVEVAQRNPANTNPEFGQFPEKTQAFIREMVAHLESLSQSADKRTAAGALQYLGLFKFSLKDLAGAKADLRRSVALEPANDGAQYLLLAQLITEHASVPDELVSICQSLLKSKNSAQNHLIFAKVLISQNNYREADDELTKAAELEPDNILRCLIAGAMALKQSTDESSLSIAVTQMTRADELLRKMPNDDARDYPWKVYVLNGAILSALLDEPTVAKDWARQVLESYPDDQTAKDIMSAIE